MRDALPRLLQEQGYGLNESCSSDKLRRVMRKGAGPVALPELRSALGALSEPQVLGTLTESFRGLAFDAALARSALTQVLGERTAPRWAFRRRRPPASRFAWDGSCRTTC